MTRAAHRRKSVTSCEEGVTEGKDSSASEGSPRTPTTQGDFTCDRPGVIEHLPSTPDHERRSTTRVVIIAMTALLCVSCAPRDRQAAAVSVDVSSASALASSMAESQEAAAAESSASAVSAAPSNPGSGGSGEVASATPVAERENSPYVDAAADPPLASVNAFVGKFWGLSNETSMRGQFLAMSEFPAVYSLIGCAFNCRSSAFALPVADGPLTRVASGPGTVQWTFTQHGYYPGAKPTHLYPGQVYFTAAHNGPTPFLRELGFVEIPLGEMVGSGIQSFKVPASWPTPAFPFVGEVRLFPLGVKLPADFLPADGRTISSTTQLGIVLDMAGFPEVNGGFIVPKLAPVDAYQWAIASRGRFPLD